MKVGKRMKTLAAAVGLLMALGACGGEGVTLIGDDNEPDPERALGFTPLTASPERLEFTHVIGESPCVQLVGMVTIRNTAQNRVVATVSVFPPLLLRGIGDLVREGSVGIEANQSRQFEVFFDCTQRKDFEGSVRISDGTARVAVIPVVGHVR